jgi:signal peptide peptidase SppA
MTKHFLAECLATPWAMDPKYIKAYGDMLVRGYQRHEARAAGSHEGEERAAPQAARQAATPKILSPGIGVVSVTGALVSHASDLGPCDGGISYDSVRGALRAAQADDQVGQILLAIDSPGGSVFGCMELADDIRNSSKPVTAIACYTAASAAYWLGSAASEFWVSPSGQVGSIGVWMAHQDVTGAMEQQGIVTTLISAGKYKVEGNPYEPLGEDARANMQASVDEFYTSFVKAVAKGRNVSVDAVRNGMGQGRMLAAKDALAEKMVDQVGTFEDCVAAMQRKARRSSGAARARAQLAIASA